MKLLNISDRRYNPALQKYIYTVTVSLDPLTSKTVTVHADPHDTYPKIFYLACNLILYGDQNGQPHQSSLSDFTQP